MGLQAHEGAGARCAGSGLQNGTGGSEAGDERGRVGSGSCPESACRVAALLAGDKIALIAGKRACVQVVRVACRRRGRARGNGRHRAQRGIEGVGRGVGVESRCVDGRGADALRSRFHGDVGVIHAEAIPGGSRHRVRMSNDGVEHYPIAPSISSLMRLFISTAYSSGSSLLTGSAKPLTTMVRASSSGIPRLIR